MHSICLSVYPSICAKSNFRKYSSNVFKFIHAVYILRRMDSIENDMHGIKCSFTDTQKFFDTFRPLGGEVFKAYCNIIILH